MQNAASAEAERAARMAQMLRLNLSIRDGSANVYWKHDGQRFVGSAGNGNKATDWRSLCSGSTLKLCTGRTYQLTLTSNRPNSRIRPHSGRWDVKEIDAEGRDVDVQFEIPKAQPHISPPPPPPSSSSALPLSSSAPWDLQGNQLQQPPPVLTPPGKGEGPPPSQSALSSALGEGLVAASPTSGGSGGGHGDPRALQWVDATADAARSTFTADLPWNLAPSAAGRRQYLIIEAYMEDFGHVVCPLQIKVYKPTDKNALSSFPLRFVQFDFREDSSGAGCLFAVNYYRF